MKLKWKKTALAFGALTAKALAENAPGIIENIVKKKEEKSFFEENKSWIFMTILSIFITNLNYINLFNNVILNSIINIIYGIVVLILTYLFYYEEKDIFKEQNSFIKALGIILLILGIINSISHICCAISNMTDLFLQ